MKTVEIVVNAHGANVYEYYLFKTKLYMIIEQGHDEYAIKVNDLETDFTHDGIWLKVNGNSRYETIGGASRALLQHLEENQ